MIVGGFVIVGSIIFMIMLFQFGELPTGIAKLTSFTVNVNFLSAPGVQENTQVQYCGYHIGRVIHVSPPKPYTDTAGLSTHQVTVSMAISNDYSEIPANVRVELIKRGLGSSYIELKSEPMLAADLEKLDPKYLKEGIKPLKGYTGTGSDFLPADLEDKIGILFNKVSLLLDSVNSIVGDRDNQNNLKTTMSNLAKATAESIETLKQIRSFSESGTQTSEELASVLIEFRHVLYKINNGQGTVGKLINDDRLYENLINSSEELKLSLEKLKQTLDKTSRDGIKVKVF